MPKKKTGKKGAKIIDGVATNEMSREQLMGHVKRMQVELNREREERNFFMLEREKLYALWNITLEQLVAAKADTRLADVRMDDNEKEREAEMQIYKQKLRYLMTEQSRRVSEVRLHNLQQMKAYQESTSSVQTSMRQTLERKNREISNAQTSIYAMMRQLKLENAEHASKLQTDFCAELRRIESTFERMMFEREKASELQEAIEIQRTQTEKSEHIRQLMDLHQTQLKDMKDYFNEITANNFAVISALQEELARSREKEQELGMEVVKCRKAYKTMEENFRKEKEEAESRFKQDRKSAQEIKRQLELAEKKIKGHKIYAHNLEIGNEALIQRAELAGRERDMLKGSFTKSILDMQKKASMQRLVLEMKLNAMNPRRTRNHQFTPASPGSHSKDDRNLQFRPGVGGSTGVSSVESDLSDDGGRGDVKV